MRRNLWMLLILFLFIVGRESCCASSASAQEQFQGQDISPAEVKLWLVIVVGVQALVNCIIYWIFDLHQKEKGWYTCKFFYAAGYRTKLFYNRIYLDFFSSFPAMITSCRIFGCLRGIVLFSFLININVRIYRGFYIVLTIPVLFVLSSMVSTMIPSTQ